MLVQGPMLRDVGLACIWITKYGGYTPAKGFITVGLAREIRGIALWSTGA